MRLRRSFCRYFFAPARSSLQRVDYVGVASLPVLYMVDVVYALLSFIPFVVFTNLGR